RCLSWATRGIGGSGVVYQILAARFGLPAITAMYYVFQGPVDVTQMLGRSTYDMIGPIPRMQSLAGEPGFTGLFLIFPWAMLVSSPAAERTTRRRRVLFRLGMAAMLLAIFVTGSTTAYIAFAAALAALVVLPVLRRRPEYRS